MTTEETNHDCTASRSTAGLEADLIRQAVLRAEKMATSSMYYLSVLRHLDGDRRPRIQITTRASGFDDMGCWEICHSIPLVAANAEFSGAAASSPRPLE